MLSWCHVIHVSNPDVCLVARMLRVSAHLMTASVHHFFDQNTAASVRHSRDK